MLFAVMRPMSNLCRVIEGRLAYVMLPPQQVQVTPSPETPRNRGAREHNHE